MDYNETNISFLYEDLMKAYGQEKADFLYMLMCEKYTSIQPMCQKYLLNFKCQC